MKKIIITAFSALLFTSLSAQKITGDVSVDSLHISRNGKFLAVSMKMNTKDLNVPPVGTVIYTPRIVNGKDSTDLKSVGIYGRNRYFTQLRNENGPITGEDEMFYKAAKTPGVIDYDAIIPFEEWMNGADFKLHRSDCGCCKTVLAENENNLGKCDDESIFFPTLINVTPVAEAVKKRELKGEAFVDFVVNKTYIHPTYRNNANELGKIRSTIDVVKSDSDVTITKIYLKGFASPESPYEHNTYLARERTIAVKNYIKNYYDFDSSIFETDYEPEDWVGLREFVEKSPRIANKKAILKLIDAGMDPDVKENKIKQNYWKDYNYIFNTCYPALRRTDYRVVYVITEYTTIEELRNAFENRPQNLSLNDFYRLAKEYPAGSPEYEEVFETAVRMYPNDEIANLNAANTAMRLDKNDAAKKYLAKAGDSAEAVYARGVLAYRTQDFKSARAYMEKALEMGVEKAQEVLDTLGEIGK
ncbi:MAG: DUF3868 domain-containing protein [Bacteroidales bacterium]|nr:DUF3868 domain-containing protein [Bacteroidales bacterium]